MKFLALWKPAKDADTLTPPPPGLMAEMGQLMQDMTQRGSLIGGEGLHPTAKGARIRTKNGKLTITDGPFAETKELIASFAMLEASSLAEAIELTKPFMELNQRYGYEGESEIRQVFGPEDFDADGVPQKSAAAHQ